LIALEKTNGTEPLIHAQQALNRDPATRLYSHSLITYYPLYRKTYDKLQPWYDDTQTKLVTKGKLESVNGLD